ncbi:MAG: hypothetical protein GY941_16205 [Planctomycetes bacterium]|nr:hypothetical protein [Planctomycetota bacterium]
MKTYKFKHWFKNAFIYENDEELVYIREYDYRDCFEPVITERQINVLIIDECIVEYLKKEKR